MDENQKNTYRFNELCETDKNAVFNSLMFLLADADIEVQWIPINPGNKRFLRLAIVGHSNTCEVELNARA